MYQIQIDSKNFSNIFSIDSFRAYFIRIRIRTSDDIWIWIRNQNTIDSGNQNSIPKTYMYCDPE